MNGYRLFIRSITLLFIQQSFNIWKLFILSRLLSLVNSTINQNQQCILPSQASGWRRPSSSSEQPGASDPHRKPLPPDRNRIRSPPIPASLCWGWNTKHQLWLINTMWIILLCTIYISKNYIESFISFTYI